MKHLKKYKIFESIDSDLEDIYEFANMLKGWQPYPPLSEVKSHSERFIGPGIYDKVKRMVDDIFDKPFI